MTKSDILKAKLKAAAIHAIFTLVVALAAGFLVYGFWYPGRFSEMMRGTDLYRLVLFVEFCLGPAISLVIYNPLKKRSELVRDYLIVGLVQISALGYGMHSVFESRPVYLVFVKDRIELVSASEIAKESSLEARYDMYRRLPIWGPKRACYRTPTDEAERLEVIFTGKKVHQFPKYFAQCGESEILDAALSARTLLEDRETYQVEMNTLEGLEFSWLPINTRMGMWTEIYMEGDGLRSPEYRNIDPYLY